VIISHSRRFIFLKTRKTAGSSVQMALAAACDAADIVVGDDSRGAGHDVGLNIERAFSRNAHANLAQIRLAVPAGDWPSFFKFTFVRNPWDLVVSRYHWERKGKACSIDDFRRWLPAYVDADQAAPLRNDQGNIVQRVWESGGGFANDLQSPFAFDGATLGVQFVGRYESLAEDLGTVCGMLGICPGPLPRLKVGYREGKGYLAFYDTHASLLVRRAFACDIENFAYVF
jgi:hypothetical protein